MAHQASSSRSEYRLVILHDAGQQLRDPRASALLAHLLRLKAQAYGAEYKEARAPIDAADLFGTHLAVCVEDASGELIPVSVAKTATWHDYRRHGMAFPCVPVLQAAATPGDLAQLHAILDGYEDKPERLAYVSGWAVDARYRGRPELMSLLLAFVMHWHRATVDEYIAGAVVRFKTDQRIGALGAEAISGVVANPDLEGERFILMRHRHASELALESLAHTGAAWADALWITPGGADQAGHAYVLESENEFHRLEQQSALAPYSHEQELEGICVPDGAAVLDAGCGSGVVARYMARRWPGSTVLGADLVQARLAQAADAARGIDNLRFERHDLASMDCAASSFDLAWSRFVFQHLPERRQEQVARELWRVLRPGGQVCLVDVDGMLGNLYPTVPLVDDVVRRIAATGVVDLHVGRKLPCLLRAAGFVDVEWRVIPMCFQGATLQAEIAQYKERFAQAAPALAEVFPSAADLARFEAAYYGCLEAPGAVLYYSKFVVTARKPH